MMTHLSRTMTLSLVALLLGAGSAAAQGFSGSLFVKSQVSGEGWNVDIDIDASGFGTYTRTGRDGTVLDQGTIAGNSSLMGFESKQSDCTGIIVENEDHPGKYQWVAVCDMGGGVVTTDGGLGVLKS